MPARLAALAVIAAMLLQGALGLPATLRMQAGPGAICGAVHPASGGGDTPAPLAHHHAHCLLCQGGLLPPLIPAAEAAAVPMQAPLAAPAGNTPLPVPQRPRPAFASRAPPASA